MNSMNEPITVKKAAKAAGSQTGITWEPKLASGLDTLKMTFWIDFSGSYLIPKLESAKKKAQEEDLESEPLDLGGYEFNLMRTGVQMFQFRLIRGDVKLLLSSRKYSSDIPNCRLEIGSLSCWTPGYNTIYEEFKQMIETLGGIIMKEKVSEAHLTVDLIGIDIKTLPVADQDHWITRAKTFSPHYKNRKLTGVSIGSGDLMLRIYDKIDEMKTKSRHKIEPFLAIWALDDIETVQVTRVEFQVRRSILKEFKINEKSKSIDTLEDLNNSLASIWSYLISDWARLTDSPVDRSNNHQGRADNHEIWERLKKADFSGCLPAKRITQGFICDLQALSLQMAGLGMTISAALKRKRHDLESIIAFSQGAVEGALRKLFRDKEDFMKRMDRKYNRITPPFLEPQPA